MSLSEKQIKDLNNSSVAAQNAGLGDFLANLEGKSGGGEIQKVVNEMKKELEDSNSLVMGIEDGLKKEDNKIRADIAQLVNKINEVSSSVNSFSSMLADVNKKIEELKAVKAEPVAPPIVSKRIEADQSPADEEKPF
jgi:methyl-accepting chemotaxis protein